MQHSAKVRKATVLDIMALTRVAEIYAAETEQMKVHKLDIQTLMTSYMNTIIVDTGYLSVLEVDGKIVGGMWGIMSNMPWSTVKVAQDIALFVQKEYRGIGTLLVDDWLNWAESEGAKEVILSTASGIKPEAFGRLMKRKGLTLQGHTYSKEI